jgi:hypothetical protein
VQGRLVNGALTKAQHLVRRFFGHVSVRPLSPAEQDFVDQHLSAPCAELFWLQSAADQRHAFKSGRRVATALPDDGEAVEAALLHDIGKWKPYVGPVTRSIATLLDLARLPMTRNMRAYRDHARLGAEQLEAAGCGRLAVEFARNHAQATIDGPDAERWQVLYEADTS